MVQIRRAKAKSFKTRDAKKEGIFKELALKLDTLGVKVRREKLKVGHGWKVVSGSCRALDKRLLFVDNRLTQDEQIELLKSRLIELEPVADLQVAAAC